MSEAARPAKGKTAWSDADEMKLYELAEIGLSAKEAGSVLGRSESATATANKAKALRDLGRAVSFNSPRNNALRTFADRGGVMLREDLGGVVGVRWCAASRSGETFETPICEKLLELGRIKPARHAPDGCYRLAMLG